MNCKGQIDQGIASIVVFFGVFAAVAFFVILTSNLVNVLNVTPDNSFGISEDTGFENANSRVLGELFLSSSVVYDGSEVKVKDAFVKAYSKIHKSEPVHFDVYSESLKPLEEKFGDCGELLFISEPSVGGVSGRTVYIEYPVRKWSENGEGLPRQVDDIQADPELIKNENDKRSNFLYDLYSSVNGDSGITGDYYFYRVESTAYVFVRGGQC